MRYLFDGIRSGLFMLFPPTREITEIILLSLVVSGIAAVIGCLIGLPAGIFIALKEFKLKRFVVAVANTLLSIPSVFIGLVVYIFLSRKGLLGNFDFLFTPSAIVIAQTILVTPIMLSLSISAFHVGAKEIKDTAYSLGATRFQAIMILIGEKKVAVFTTIIVGFSRIIGETGMTLMVGGNIKGETRVMTTAMALETMKGNFEFAIAIGVVLILLSVILNFVLQILQRK